jgi:Ca-activated chloride channel homolog
VRLPKCARELASSHEGADEHRVRNLGLLLLGVCVFVTNFRGESVLTIHKNVTEVGFALVATDRSGKSLPSLSAADIEVLENGQPVPNFEIRPAENNPLRVGILLDLSDSTRKGWPQTRAALADFLQQLMRPDDETLLVAFDSKVELVRTVSRPKEAAALIPELQGGGPTALYDAVYSVCQHPTFSETGVPRRSALILFSDGDDNLSIHDLDQAIVSAESRCIAVYTISVRHKKQVENPGERILRKLAESTGGRAFVVKQDRELRAALDTISAELRRYYLLYYRPPDEMRSREFRHVRIVPTQNTGPVLRYRDGYSIVPSSERDH